MAKAKTKSKPRLTLGSPPAKYDQDLMAKALAAADRAAQESDRLTRGILEAEAFRLYQLAYGRELGR
jgi:hypothetical protein